MQEVNERMITASVFMCFLMISSIFSLSDVRFKYYETEKNGNKCRFNMHSYVNDDEQIFDKELCKMYTCHILHNKAFMEHAMCKLPQGYRKGCIVEEKTGRFPHCCFNRKMSCPPIKEENEVDSIKGSKNHKNNSKILHELTKNTKNCPCLQ